MPTYIDFLLSEYRYGKVIECLKEYCEKSTDFYEIEDVFYIIRDLNEQKDEFYKKMAEDFKRKTLKEQ